MNQEQYERNREYLAAISLLKNMFVSGLLDEADYVALETKYADIFLPLFRYEKPCLLSTLPIRLTGAALPHHG